MIKSKKILIEKAKNLIAHRKYKTFLYKVIDFILLHIININWYIFGRADMCTTLKNDNRFKISDRLLFDILNRFPIKKYDIEKIKLCDIKYFWQGQIISIDETATYDYIVNKNTERYIKYIKEVNTDSSGRISNRIFDIIAEDLERCRDTIKAILTEGYDIKKDSVIIDDRNIIIDGLHRTSILWNKFGGEYKIAVLKVYYNRFLS